MHLVVGIHHRIQRQRWYFLVLAIFCGCCFQVTQANFRFHFNTGGSSYNFQQRPAKPQEDPYRILGIPRSATSQEIKAAYRSLAKEHHPDKGGKPEVFAKIAGAYEILSDPTQKRQYDQTSRFQQSQRSQQRTYSSNNNRYSSSNNRNTYNSNNNNFRNQQRQNTPSQRQQQQFRDRLRQKQQQNEAKKHQEQQQRQEQEKQRSQTADIAEATRLARRLQRTLPKISTIEDLVDQGFLTNRTQSSISSSWTGTSSELYFTKNVMLAFCGNKRQEATLTDLFLFPYPFGGSHPHGLKWDDVLVSARVRYNKDTDLTRLFRVSMERKASDRPYIVFGRAGSPVTHFHTYAAPRMQTSQVQDTVAQFYKWVYGVQLKRSIRITNHHHSTIKVYRETAKLPLTPNLGPQFDLLQTISSNHSVPVVSVHIGDRLLVVDAKTDAYPGSVFLISQLRNITAANGALLIDWLVDNDETFVVPNVECFDLSLKCKAWATTKTRPESVFSPLSGVSNACNEHKEYMLNICPAACGVCKRSATQESKSSMNQEKDDATQFAFRSFLGALLASPIHIIQSIGSVMHRQELSEGFSFIGDALNYEFGPHRWPLWLQEFWQDMKHMLDLRQGVVALCCGLGAIGGINLFTLFFWMFGGFRAENRSFQRGRGQRLRKFGLLLLFSFWGWLFANADSAGSLKRDLRYMNLYYRSTIFPLLGLGIIFGFALEATLTWIWTGSSRFTLGDSNKRPQQILLSAISLVILDYLTFRMFDELWVGSNGSDFSSEWKRLWKNHRTMATIMYFTGGALSTTMLPLLFQVIWRLRVWVFLSFLNCSFVAGSALWITNDSVVAQDLVEVMEMEANAPLALIMVGFVLAFLSLLLVDVLVRRRTHFKEKLD